MIPSHLKTACLFFLLLECLPFPQNSSASDTLLINNAKTTLLNATRFLRSISTHGGYAGIYSIKTDERFGEGLYEHARETEILVQKSGTIGIGSSFLRAFNVTNDSLYLTAATDAAYALAWGQRPIGGWSSLADLSHFKSNSTKPVKLDGQCTLDDDVTQGALLFLMTLDEIIDTPWLSETIELGLEYIKKSQFENGAWPQFYPLIGGYHDFYTFNDKAINGCITVLLTAHEKYGDKSDLHSALRGGEFIILSQNKAPQAGWAQQYNHDLIPAQARPFEPPGICSKVTIRNIKSLLDLYSYTKDKKYLKPIPAAVEWLENSKIDTNKWARLYEIDTNKPIYGKSGKVFYDYYQLSSKRRHRYAWQGSYGFSAVLSYYSQVISIENQGSNTENISVESKTGQISRQKKFSKKINKIISSMDNEGRWIKKNRIFCKTYYNNINYLCQFLENLYFPPKK